MESNILIIDTITDTRAVECNCITTLAVKRCNTNCNNDSFHKIDYSDSKGL